VQCHIRFS